MKHFYEGGNAMPYLEQRRTFIIQSNLKTFLNSFQCLLLSLSTYYYQFSCNVQESRASGTTGYGGGRRGADGRRVSAAVLLTIFCVLFTFAFAVEAQAQELRQGGAVGQPEVMPLVVGQKVPEEFWTQEHLFYLNGDTLKQDLAAHKGKWLIIDFWATWCAGCLSNFYKLEEIREEFSQNMEVLLVNAQSTKDSFKKIERAYDLTIKNNLWKGELPSVIMDNYLINLFPHVGVPYYVWIGPKGTVYAQTRTPFVNTDQISNILKSES